MKVTVLKPKTKYVKEGQIIDLPDHIAELGIKKGLLADAKPKAKTGKKAKK